MDGVMQSFFWGYSFLDHLSLHFVGILEVHLTTLGFISIFHVFSSFILVHLRLTFLFNKVQVIQEWLHFFFSSSLFVLNMIYHNIYSFLSFLKLVCLSSFHVFFDDLTSLDPQVVFNHIDVLVDLSYFFIFVNQSNWKSAVSYDWFTLNSFSLHDCLHYNMFSANVTNFGFNSWESKLKNKIFWNFRHELSQLNLVLSLIDFLPFVSENFTDSCSLKKIFSDKSDYQIDLCSYQRNYSSQGVTESFV